MSDDLLSRMTKALREEGGAEPTQDRSELVRARVLAQTKRRAQLRPQGLWQWAAVVCLGFFVSTAMAHVIRVQLPRVLEALRADPPAPPPAPAAKRARELKPKAAAPPEVVAPPEVATPEAVAPPYVVAAPPAQPAVVAPNVAKAPAATPAPKPLAPARPRPVKTRAPRHVVRVPVAAAPPVPEQIVVREPTEIEPAQASAPPPSAAPAHAPPTESAELVLFRRAQALHLSHDARAIEAWDAYLRAAPSSALAPEARYNRALGLVRAGRFTDAKSALAPFAEGKYGAYRRQEAQALLGRLPK